ncbi:MAG TPA: hypothetical protein VIL81_01900 [Candidatus Limnocylindrales bacterium]
MLYLSQAIGRPVLDANGKFATPTRPGAIGSEFGGGPECST